MKKINFNSKMCLLTSLIMVGALFSCASSQVYVTDAADFTATNVTEAYDLDSFSFSWNGYNLTKSSIDVSKIDYKKIGLDKYDNKVAAAYDLSKSDVKYSTSYIITVSNKEPIDVKKIFENKSEVYLVHGPKSTKLKIEGTPQDTLMIDDSSVLPLRVTRIGKVEREGKVFSMPANQLSGVRIKLYGQNYAIIDFVSDTPRILMCNTFNHDLSQDEKDFVSTLMLLLYNNNKAYTGFSK